VIPIHWRSARELSTALRRREVSAVEVLEAHLAQVARVNPQVNAIVTLDPRGGRAAAEAVDRRIARGEPLPALAGLPVAVKDLEETAGMRTTYGSPIHRDHVPDDDSLIVERLRSAGAVVFGKTNTPEFGAGSHTFNPVFGSTRNPYDLGRSAGGSSGGAAVAVACGMLPFADGSDLAASVRNPAAFCNVVGLRPSPGRWPDQAADPWDPLPVFGPIARTVDDAAMLFEALAARPDRRAPLSTGLTWEAGPVEPVELKDLRIAWSVDLGDLPVEAEVRAVLDRLRAELERAGCQITSDHPDLVEADEAFDVLRALEFVAAFGPMLEEHEADLKDTIVWNTRLGLELLPQQIARAQLLRGRVFQAMRTFLEDYDVLALPTVQVAPFPIEADWVRSIEGRPMAHYIEWLCSCSRITVTAHPAISIPGGFAAGGLPIGVQLVGRYRCERTLLRIAAAIEAATRFGDRRPPLALG
jgi:amidase